MKKPTGYFAVAFCVLFTGCAGLNARKEAKTASQNVAAAEASVKAAKQGGATTCAAMELKLAESDLKLAKSNLGKKAYSLALPLAKSADSNAAAAAKKCEAAKRKEAETRNKTKKNRNTYD